MRAFILLPIALLCGVVGFVALDACNSGNGDCPAKESIAPGASCSDEHLQCAFGLKTPNAACDGTSTAINTSCTCTNGSWACPDPFVCEAGAGDGGDDGSADAGDEDRSSPPDDGGSDAPDGVSDAPADAPDAG